MNSHRPGYYAYVGTAELGCEPVGTEGKLLRWDLKTDKGALRAAARAFGNRPFRLFHFMDFYDDSSFVEVIE